MKKKDLCWIFTLQKMFKKKKKSTVSKVRFSPFHAPWGCKDSCEVNGVICQCQRGHVQSKIPSGPSVKWRYLPTAGSALRHFLSKANVMHPILDSDSVKHLQRMVLCQIVLHLCHTVEDLHKSIGLSELFSLRKAMLWDIGTKKNKYMSYMQAKTWFTLLHQSRSMPYTVADACSIYICFIYDTVYGSKLVS